VLNPEKSYTKQTSCFFQEVKSSTLAEYFRSINLTFNQYVSTAMILWRNEEKVIGNIAAVNRSENNKKLRFKKLVCSSKNAVLCATHVVS